MTVELNEKQIEFLLNLLDQNLKLQGLTGLLPVVDLYNALNAAKKTNEVNTQEPIKSRRET